MAKSMSNVEDPSQPLEHRRHTQAQTPRPNNATLPLISTPRTFFLNLSLLKTSSPVMFGDAIQKMKTMGVRQVTSLLIGCNLHFGVS